MASYKIESLTVPPQRFKKTLVYYYMPNCPYCKQFAPVFLKLAALCADMPFCSLKAVDITKHDSVGVPIQTVPTIMYFDSLGTPHKMHASSAEKRTIMHLALFYKDQYEMDSLK